MKNLPKEFKNIDDLLDEDLYYKSSILDVIKKFFVDRYYFVRNFFKYSIYLRWKHKIDPRDTWELDIVITKYIVRTLNHLRGHKDLKDFDSIMDALEKYMDDHDYSNYHEAEVAYHKLYDLIGHDLVVSHHSKFLAFVIPRLEYLKAHNHGYPEFATQKLKKKGLLDYRHESQETQWDMIQQAMIDGLKSDTEADRKEGFRILSEIVFNLWD
jgi:hypothetical protein